MNAQKRVKALRVTALGLFLIGAVFFGYSAYHYYTAAESVEMGLFGSERDFTLPFSIGLLSCGIGLVLLLVESIPADCETYVAPGGAH